MPDPRSLHAHPSGACPWTIYLYMQGNELKVWPAESITIRYGEGVVWTPIQILGGGPVGNFHVAFEDPQNHPFEAAHFDESTRYSGPTRVNASRTYQYKITHAGHTYSPFELVVVGLPVGSKLPPKSIAVSDNNGTTAVDCPSMPVWSGLDEIEWKTDNPKAPITVEFKRNVSPFTWEKQTSEGVLQSGKVEKPGRKKYHYTITLEGLQPLDPDVEVDPPGGGG